MGKSVNQWPICLFASWSRPVVIFRFHAVFHEQVVVQKNLIFFFIKIKFGKNKSQTTLCVYAHTRAHTCLCVGCSAVVMLVWGVYMWLRVANSLPFFCHWEKMLHRYSWADRAYLGISVCSLNFSFLSKVFTYNIRYGADVLTNGRGKQDCLVFDNSVLLCLFLAIMFSSNPHIKVMWRAWFKITKARQFKRCI